MNQQRLEGLQLWFGNEYSYSSSPQLRWARRLLEDVSLPTSPGATVVDVGCGDGKVSFHLSLAHPRCSFLGVDHSESQITFAMSHHCRRNLQFLLGKAEHLSLVVPVELHGKIDAVLMLLGASRWALIRGVIGDFVMIEAQDLKEECDARRKRNQTSPDAESAEQDAAPDAATEGE